MKTGSIRRIKYYSLRDITNGRDLIRAEKLLFELISSEDLENNDLFEYYNIRLFFENNLFLADWDETKRKSLSDSTEQYFSELKQRLLRINDKNLEGHLSDLEYQYQDDFWQLFDRLSIFNNISKEAFERLLVNNPNQIRNILNQRRIVDKFNPIIRDFLLSYKHTAEILLSKYEERHNFQDKHNYYFPKSLSLSDKESILISYINSDDPNLNFIRLIENSKDTDYLKLSAKTRLIAKKRSVKLNDEIMENGHVQSFDVKISIIADQDEPVLMNSDGLSSEISYAESFLDLHDTNVSLFKLFDHLFFYLNDTKLIYLVSKSSQLNVIERTLMVSKNEYEMGVVFMKNEMVSSFQLRALDSYSERKRDLKIEDLINSFVGYINSLINPNKIEFIIRVSNSTYLEKIRNLLPEFEFLLKQYQSYVEEGEIDLELIQLGSTPIRFGQIASLLDEKYIYSDNDRILRLKYLFFSDQSGLYYTDIHKTKYDNFFDLITNEEIGIGDFANYQQDTIQDLIQEGCLFINYKGFIEIEEIYLLCIIRELYFNEVLSYWHYPEFIRKELDQLIEDGTVSVQSTLFSEKEKNYFNYYLNKKEYTNGHDLRNKYSHGTNLLSENHHENDYYVLLKLIILVLLKIEDDILLWKRFSQNSV